MKIEHDPIIDKILASLDDPTIEIPSTEPKQKPQVEQEPNPNGKRRITRTRASYAPRRKSGCL